MRDDFSAKTIDTLSRRAGFLCSNPDCRKHTVGSNETHDKSTLVGVAAHITAASPGGARYDESITSAQRRSISNGIWLCPSCSTLIDRDPRKFSVELLNDWKAQVEKESADKLQNKALKKKVVVIAKQTLQERAERNKILREKELVRNAFLRSAEAIEEARNQVRIIIEKLKEVKRTMDDPATGFILAFEARREEMYAIGRNRRYVCFNWCRPSEWDINVAMLKVSLYQSEGVWEFDRQDTPFRIIDYKYSRDLDGTNGWVDFQTGENFISTEDLVNQWVEEFLQYIGYA